MEQWHYDELTQSGSSEGYARQGMGISNHAPRSAITYDRRRIRKAIRFIEALVANGVPIEAIDTNDFASTPSALVVVAGKDFRRFEKADLKRALDHYNTRTR